jgi:hypothetical protein
LVCFTDFVYFPHFVFFYIFYIFYTFYTFWRDLSKCVCCVKRPNGVFMPQEWVYASMMIISIGIERGLL